MIAFCFGMFWGMPPFWSVLDIAMAMHGHVWPGPKPLDVRGSEVAVANVILYQETGGNYQWFAEVSQHLMNPFFSQIGWRWCLNMFEPYNLVSYTFAAGPWSGGQKIHQSWSVLAKWMQWNRFGLAVEFQPLYIWDHADRGCLIHVVGRVMLPV